MHSHNKPDGTTYKYYAPVTINGRHACYGMIDSGNTWRTAISYKMFLQLGLPPDAISPLPNTPTVGTASDSGSLTVRGELSDPITLTLGDSNIPLTCYPVVLDNLAMPLNIAGPFLKQNNIDQLHSEDVLRIGQHKIKLLSVHQTKTPAKVVTSGVYTTKKHVIQPRSESIVPLRIAEIHNGTMSPGPGLLSTTDGHFMENTDTHPWLQAAVSSASDGHTYGGIMNTLDTPITIPAGSRYGFFELFDDSPYPAHNRLSVVTQTPDNFDSHFGSPSPEPHTSPTDTTSRRREISNKFKLPSNPLLKNPTDLEDALDTITPFYDTFSWDGSPGETDLIYHTIPLKENTQPVADKHRPTNPALETSLRKQLKDWTDQNVVTPCSSPWNACLVAVAKPHGKVRWCVDYRKLNKLTIKDNMPIGSISNNMDKLQGSRIFTVLDSSGAFNNIPLDPNDSDKTAFSTPWGQYKFLRLPFGLTGAPSTYARLVQKMLEGIPMAKVVPYLDDIIIHSHTLKDHFRQLRDVLSAHERAGLKLNPDKCSFFQTKTKYLGHIVSQDGIQPDPSHVKIIKDWPIPKTRKEVRIFMGKINYYRRYIKNFSTLASPLVAKLSSKDGTTDKQAFTPDDKFTEAFNTLKKLLTSAPILAYPDFHSENPFIVDTDYSQENRAVGGVLSQVQDGVERVIDYAARTLPHGALKYGSTKGELCGIITFLKYWKYYLQFRPFIIRTDNKALESIATMADPTGMIERWRWVLSNFNFTIQYRPGPQHGNADALSRAPHITEITDVSEGERIMSISPPTFCSLQNVKQEQAQDPDISPLLPWVASRTKPDKLSAYSMSERGRTYAGLIDDLAFDAEGILRYHKHITTPDSKQERSSVILLPQALWRPFTLRAHEDAAHAGTHSTYIRLARTVFFTGMLKEVEYCVTHCLTCQAKQGPPKPQHHTLLSKVSGFPFQTLSIDFQGPLPRTAKGHEYLLTIIDPFTKWVEAFPTRNMTAATVVDILTSQIFNRYGIPHNLHSDQGTSFVNNLVHSVASTLGIRTTTTPAYHPASNPIERVHRSLNAALTALTKGSPNTWDQHLPTVLYALRTATHSSTGLPPYKLLFGRDPPIDLDCMFGGLPPQHTYASHQDYARALQHKLLAAHQWARSNMSKAVFRQRRAYHKDKKTFTLKQRVWLFTPTYTGRKKYNIFWTGPWTITKVINDTVYEISPDPSWTRKTPVTVTIDRLKPFLPPDLNHSEPAPPDIDLSMHGDEYAEAFSIDPDSLPRDPTFLHELNFTDSANLNPTTTANLSTPPQPPLPHKQPAQPTKTNHPSPAPHSDSSTPSTPEHTPEASPQYYQRTDPENPFTLPAPPPNLPQRTIRFSESDSSSPPSTHPASSSPESSIHPPHMTQQPLRPILKQSTLHYHPPPPPSLPTRHQAPARSHPEQHRPYMVHPRPPPPPPPPPPPSDTHGLVYAANTNQVLFDLKLLDDYIDFTHKVREQHEQASEAFRLLANEPEPRDPKEKQHHSRLLDIYANDLQDAENRLHKAEAARKAYHPEQPPNLVRKSRRTRRQ